MCLQERELAQLCVVWYNDTVQYTHTDRQCKWQCHPQQRVEQVRGITGEQGGLQAKWEILDTVTQ